MRVTRLPLTGGDKPLDDLADLHRGHRADVGARLQADSVQHSRP
nr:hypothetical protein [Streptomyces geranii]